MKLKKYITAYFKRKSLWNILGDFLFVVVLLLLLIPATRKETTAFFIRSTLFLKNPRITYHEKVDTTLYWELEGINADDQALQFGEGIVFINLWATWCPPCIAEMPSIQKLYNAYSEEIEFIILSNEQEATLEKFLTKNHYTFPVYRSNGMPEFVKSNALPTTYLIRDDEIIMIKKGAINWNSKHFRVNLDEMLQNN